MNKLTFMYKQLTNALNEIRKAKRFHKQSSMVFKQFYETMVNSISLLTTGDLYNDIQYIDLLNKTTIEYFNKHVK
jgi:hypothetical protein